MQLNFDELRELIAALDRTDIAELTLKSADFELTVRRGGSADRLTLGATEAVLSVPPAGVSLVPTAGVPAGTVPTPAETSPAPAPASDRKWVEINSPLVGTFYRSPAPDEPPFAEVGDRIRVGQTVCIIEAMKVMNELEAEVSGQVMEILVKNGEPVEYGQPLMRVNPD